MSDSFIVTPDELKNIDVRLLVEQFVQKYVKNKAEALLWADTAIDKRLYPILKPAIRAALLSKGYTIKSGAPEGPKHA